MTIAGYRYRHAIAAQDGTTATAIPPLVRWAQREPAPHAVVAARHFASVLRATVGTLGDERWPPGVRAKVAALRSHARALIALLSRVPHVTTVGRAAWAVRLERLAELVGADGKAARRALRLPCPALPVQAG